MLIPTLLLGATYSAVQRVAEACSIHWEEDGGHDNNQLAAQVGLSSVMSNLLAVHFFMWLRDEGSWLQIGSSISHYVIAMGIGLAAFLCAQLGRVMLRLAVGPSVVAINQRLRKSV